MQVDRKFKVFISSSCGGKYTYVRKALKKMIEDTGLAIAYVFESEPGSSEEVVSAYLEEVAECDVLILLVDNVDSVSNATLSEYNLAKKLKKKMLCFFCDETKKEKTEIQREMENPGSPKYELVHCFADIPGKVFDTLLQDLVNRYRSKLLEDIKQDIEPEINKKVSITTERLSKDILHEYSLLDNPIADKLFGENKDDNKTPTRLNELLAYFFKVTLAELPFDGQRFKELKESILGNHEEPIKSLIRIRLEALENYYANNLDDCVNSLKKAISYIKENQPMAEWLLNDVAIDLRNIINLRDNINGIFSVENEGQKIIDTSNENVVFPELDRITSSISNNAIKNYKKIALQSLYTTTFFGYQEIFKDLSSYFCVAILYGSITHIRLLPEKCAELLLPICLETNNISYYAEYIKNTIISNELKDLDESLRVANINTVLMPFINIEGLLAKIPNIPIDKRRDEARINVLKYFGYYYSESTFACEESWFFNHIKHQKTSSIIGNINTLIFETIKKCIHRFSQNNIIEYCIQCIQSKNAVLIQKCVSLTYDIDFASANMEWQEKFKLVLIDNVTTNALWSAIIQFGYKCTIDWTDLKETVKQKAPQFYAGLFSLEFVFKEKTDLYSQIIKYISTINSRNETHGNLKISAYANDLYGTIWNIIRINNLQLTWDELIPILSACEGTILAEKQVPDAKIKSLTLLLNLKNYYSGCLEWLSWGKNIFQNQECVLKASYVGVFDKTSRYAVLFAYELLKLLFNKENDFLMQLLNLPIADAYDILVCLKVLDDIDKNLRNNFSNEIKMAILQLANTLSKHKELDIRFYSVKLLIWLTDTVYCSQALDCLSQCFDNGTAGIKATILYRIKEIHGDSSIVSYIKQKALVDPNYWVRSIIKNTD